MREFALIDRLAARLASRRPDTRIGIGDDAALIAPPAGEELAITTDTLIAGRHFPHDTQARDVGYKAVAVNLSDLAAMGATPAWITIALAAPALEAQWCDAFVDGACDAIGASAVDIVGGDTTRGDLSITITAIGHLPVGTALRAPPLPAILYSTIPAAGRQQRQQRHFAFDPFGFSWAGVVIIHGWGCCPVARGGTRGERVREG